MNQHLRAASLAAAAAAFSAALVTVENRLAASGRIFTFGSGNFVANVINWTIYHVFFSFFLTRQLTLESVMLTLERDSHAEAQPMRAGVGPSVRLSWIRSVCCCDICWGNVPAPPRPISRSARAWGNVGSVLGFQDAHRNHACLRMTRQPVGKSGRSGWLCSGPAHYAHDPAHHQLVKTSALAAGASWPQVKYPAVT